MNNFKHLLHSAARTLPAAILLAGSAATAMAVPAYRGLVRVTQPDGTEITVRQTGDEFSHFMFTEDGYLLTDDASGRLVYAAILADGSIRASDFAARDAAHRSAAEKSFLAKITPEMTARAVSTAEQTVVSPFKVRRNASTTEKDMSRGLCTSTFTTTKGDVKALVLLVEYTDVRFGDETTSAYSNYDGGKYFKDMLNKEGFDTYGATGSVSDWFRYNSRDEEGNPQFRPTFDVFGPVTLPHERAYYGGNDRNGNDLRPHLMVTDALDVLTADAATEINLSDYDNDGDGYVDNVYVIYAGKGEADSSIRNTVWPHSYDLSYENATKEYDGVTVNHYACNNECDYAGKPDGIGTFCHEFSHVIGLPDLYHTTSSTAFYTPGEFSVLDYGPYNNDGRTPPNYSAYERYALDWLKPRTVPYDGEISLPALGESNIAYRVLTERSDLSANVNEFFLIENRQLVGWDKYIPASGMLIWHVDYNRARFEGNYVNNQSSHQNVDLVEANGVNRPTTGSPFPGSAGVTSYQFKSWAKKDCGVTLTNISEDADVTMNATNINADPSAVEGIEIEPAAGVDGATDGAEYFNLQGMKVTAPSKGEILIRISGNRSEKIIF